MPFRQDGMDIEADAVLEPAGPWEIACGAPLGVLGVVDQPEIVPHRPCRLEERADRPSGRSGLAVDLSREGDGQDDVARSGVSVEGLLGDQRDRSRVAEAEDHPARDRSDRGLQPGCKLRLCDLVPEVAFSGGELVADAEDAEFLGARRLGCQLE